MEVQVVSHVHLQIEMVEVYLGLWGGKLSPSSLSSIPFSIVDVIEPFSEHATYVGTSIPLTTHFGGPGNLFPGPKFAEIQACGSTTLANISTLNLSAGVRHSTLNIIPHITGCPVVLVKPGKVQCA